MKNEKKEDIEPERESSNFTSLDVFHPSPVVISSE